MKKHFDLGGINKDYNSRLSRANIINGYIENNTDGSFKRIRRANGLREFQTVGNGPIRGMFRLKQFVYVASGDELYQMTNVSSLLLGNIGGIDSIVKMNANGTDDNQVIIISDQKGFTYDETNGFLSIDDNNPNFNADFSAASLNQIFWVNDPNSNVFSGSNAANGQEWSALRRASAEQSFDPIVYIARQKSSLRIMGTRTIEHWQTDINDVIVPVRPILGATIDRGVGAQRSVAEWQDNIFWLADDGTVWQISSNAAFKISDINLDYAIRGDGQLPGYINPELAIGFFIDHPIHKHYVLTFPNDGITWVYDVNVKRWHIRESTGFGRWRVNNSVLAFDNILLGDFRTNQIFTWDENVFDEDGETLRLEIIPPAIRHVKSDLFISGLDMIMEVGTASVGEPAPKMQVKYSRDGGRTFQSKKDIEFGIEGDWQRKVKIRQFGRTKQFFEFVLKLIITDKVPVSLYEAWLEVNEDI